VARPGSFLGALDPEAAAVLEATGSVVRRASGERLCSEGDASTTAWILRSGFVKLTKLSGAGREIVLELRGPGDILGEMGAIDGTPRSAAVIALGDIELVAIDAARLRELLLRHPPIALALIEELARRLRQASDRQLELGTVDVLGRLCRRLVQLAESHGRDRDGRVLIAGGISQQELADWCGASRDSVVRALRELRNADLVESRRTQVLIHDLAALSHVTAGGG
jgi:CRP-like cAMP-binding protein